MVNGEQEGCILNLSNLFFQNCKWKQESTIPYIQQLEKLPPDIIVHDVFSYVALFCDYVTFLFSRIWKVYELWAWAPGPRGRARDPRSLGSGPRVQTIQPMCTPNVCAEMLRRIFGAPNFAPNSVPNFGCAEFCAEFLRRILSAENNDFT